MIFDALRLKLLAQEKNCNKTPRVCRPKRKKEAMRRRLRGSDRRDTRSGDAAIALGESRSKALGNYQEVRHQ
jgi:hypothetical protein